MNHFIWVSLPNKLVSSRTLVILLHDTCPSQGQVSPFQAFSSPSLDYIIPSNFLAIHPLFIFKTL